MLEESQLKRYLLSKPEAIEDYPFGPDAAVYKIADKMFALTFYREGLLNLNLKCNPREAIELRDVFDAVKPAYHMNKQHWNTVIVDGSIPRGEIERMIDNSYALVVKGLKKLVRQGLEVRHGRQAIYGTLPDHPR